MRIESIKKRPELPVAVEPVPAVTNSAASGASPTISSMRDALIKASDPAPDALAVDKGVLNPRILFNVTKELAHMCQLAIGETHRSTTYGKNAVTLVDKVANFENAFLKAAVERQKKTGFPPSQGDMALIASDLFRKLADHAKNLAACTDDHEYAAEKLVELFTDFKRYHLANGSNALLRESSERIFKRTADRSCLPLNDAPGTRFSSEVSGNVKGGLGLDTWFAKLTFLLGLSAGKNSDILIDDDLDWNVIRPCEPAIPLRNP